MEVLLGPTILGIAGYRLSEYRGDVPLDVNAERTIATLPRLRPCP